jgi:hypothetical protein
MINNTIVTNFKKCVPPNPPKMSGEESKKIKNSKITPQKNK